MKDWGVIVAAVILAAAIVFYGLCGRYMVIDNAFNRLSFKVDRLTGQVKVLGNETLGLKYVEYEVKQP